MAQLRPPAPQKVNPATGYDKAVQAALLETGLPGYKEVIDFTFYDSASIATATATPSTLFQAPTTNLANSNFYGQGSFPAGQAFLARTLRFIPVFGTSGADMIASMKGMVLQFILENAKKYAEGLAGLFPAGVGATLENINGTTAALSTGISHGNHGIAALGNVYRFTRPVVLRTLQPFSVIIIPNSVTLGATTRFYVALDGVFVRNTI